MLHSLDSPLSVNSSPVAFHDFAKTSIDEVDKYNALNECSMLAYDLDYPHFDLDEDMNSILLSSSKGDFSEINGPSINNSNNSSISTSLNNFEFLPQMTFQDSFSLDSTQTEYEKVNTELFTSKLPDGIERKTQNIPILSQTNVKNIKKKSTHNNKPKKPIVLRPFVSVWAVEMCVKQLKEFQGCASSDDQE